MALLPSRCTSRLAGSQAFAACRRGAGCMDRDEDIAAFLPTPPQPAPARRTAAIEAAMRRFDGDEAPAPVTPPRAARPASAWPTPRRAFAAAVLSAALIALIGGPIAWREMWRPPTAQSVGNPASPAPTSPVPAAG